MATDLSLLYLTNEANHHQMPIAREFARLLGGQFRFAVMSPLRAERKAAGWQEENGDNVQMLRAYLNGSERACLAEWFSEADVVVSGVMDFSRMTKRASSGRLTFYMSERWWKPDVMRESALGKVLRRMPFKEKIGRLRLLSPSFFIRAARLLEFSKNESAHYLAMGAKAASDLAFIGAFPGRKWTWGYFSCLGQGPRVPRNNRIPKVLWVGRMVPFKRLDVLLRATSIVRNHGVDFSVELVGDGPERDALMALSRELRLQDVVRFSPTLPSSSVSSLMNSADVYAFPSSAAEGWGVVLNEAMGAGAAVIAASDAGSSSLLIQNGRNGILSNASSPAEFACDLEMLLTDGFLRERIGESAWQDVRSSWSPEVAARRLTVHAQALLAGKRSSFSSGPCSAIG